MGVHERAWDVVRHFASPPNALLLAHLDGVDLGDRVLRPHDDGRDDGARRVALDLCDVRDLLLQRVVVVDEAHAAELRARGRGA
jgi:hypothetical protein